MMTMTASGGYKVGYIKGYKGYLQKKMLETLYGLNVQRLTMYSCTDDFVLLYRSECISVPTLCIPVPIKMYFYTDVFVFLYR